MTSAPPLADRDLSVPALAVTVVLWASAFVGIRAVADVFEPGPLSLGRLLVGALALTFIARPWRHAIPRGGTLGLVVVYGIVWFGAYNVALNAGEASLDAGTAALVVNIGPILIAVLAGFLLKEGFPRPLVAGMAVAFAGVVLIALSTRGDEAVSSASTTGVLLCVAAAVFYAIGALTQKPTLRTVAPAMSVWMACVIGAVVCLPYAPALLDQLGEASTGDVLWLVYLGVFPTAIGFSTWSYALRRLTAGQVASTTYLVPAVATLISWALLGEVPAPLAFVGGALCLAGVAVTRLRPRAARPAPLLEPVDAGGMKVGDRVSWDTSQGRTQGTIVEKKTKDFQLAKQEFTASDDEPKYVVESEKTGARAAHAPSALRVLKD